MESQADYVIVGGGIAGLALGAVLAGDGARVVVFEASVEYEDRVRGESMLPWGVVEAAELGVLQPLLDADARITPTWVHYDVRAYEPEFLRDEFFCTDTAGLDKPLPIKV